MFIKKEDLATIKDSLKRYEQFKNLNKELVLAYVQWARKHGFKNTKGGK